MLDRTEEILDPENQEDQTTTEMEQEEQETDTTTSTETDSSEADALEVNKTLLKEFGKAQSEAQLLREQLAEMNARLSRQESRTTQEEEEPDPLDDPDIPEFEKKRLEQTRKIIQHELRKTTKPLNDNARELKRKSDITDIKAALATHPETAGMYEAVKGEFDATLNSLQVLEPNLILTLLHGAYGKAVHSGKVGLPNKEKDVPANPSLGKNRKPATNTPVAKSKLTESDRNIMRQLKITSEEEYLDLRDGDGDVTSMVDNHRARSKK